MHDLTQDLAVDRELRLRQRIDQLLKLTYQQRDKIHRQARTIRTRDNRIYRLEQRLDLAQKRAQRNA